jgi:hypothetical protein
MAAKERLVDEKETAGVVDGAAVGVWLAVNLWPRPTV